MLFVSGLGLILLVVSGESARILAFYPTPVMSHHFVFQHFTQKLLESGHEMVVITTHPSGQNGTHHRNLTEIDMHEISYGFRNKNTGFPATMTGEKKNIFKILPSFLKMLEDVLEAQLLSDGVQKLINDKKQKFDLILSESHVYLTLQFAYIYKAPIIFFGSMGATNMNLNMAGSPNHPILYPDFLQQTLYNHTLMDKINALNIFLSLPTFHENGLNGILRRVFGPKSPMMNKLLNDMSTMFIFNIHNVWDMNKPVAKNFVFVGGLPLKPEKPLPIDLQQYLDSSQTGVVYVSFGTNVDAATFRPEKLQMLLEVFSKLPYDVLWKWNQDVLPGRSNNIRISKWLPQADLLRHPKVKLFIYQGGLHSSNEAIAAGVPVLSIPMTSDQWYNSQHVVAHGIGVQVELETATEEQMTGYIRRLIDDGSYRENVSKLRSILHDQPQPPLSRALWWAEYVIRHGSQHLRAPAANMPWTDYYELELLVCFGVLLSILTFAFLIVVCRFCFVVKKFGSRCVDVFRLKCSLS